MSSRSLLTLTAVTAGAIILGYCIYFDQKRRSDPEYKRKVHDRRQRDKELKYVMDVDGDVDESGGSVLFGGMPLFDTHDHTEMERCFLNEIKLGEQLILQGNMSDGLSHLANAIMMCAQPVPVLQTLQEALPERVFMPLIMKLHELQTSSNTASSSNKDNSTSSPDIS